MSAIADKKADSSALSMMRPTRGLSVAILVLALAVTGAPRAHADHTYPDGATMTSEAPRCVGSTAHQRFTIANTNLYNEDNTFSVDVVVDSANFLDETATFIPYGTSAVIDITLPSLLTYGTSYVAYPAAKDLAGNAYYVDDTMPNPWVAPDCRVQGIFTSFAPVRLLDTRITGPALGASQTRTLTVTGRAGVPAGAAAVVLNVTVTDTTSIGYLTVSPTGVARPVVSNLNWSAGATIPNAVTVKLGTNGSIDLYQSGPGSAQVIVDVTGYYTEGTATTPGGFASLAPARILDTRVTGGAVGSMQTRFLPVLGFGGVPAANVSAVVLNVTVADTTSTGFLSVSPFVLLPGGGAAPRPTTSNLNWSSGGVTIANQVIVKVGDNGNIAFYQSGAGTAQVVVDVAGYFLAGTPTLPGTFVPLTPARVLDTRGTTAVDRFMGRALVVSGLGGLPTMGVPGPSVAAVVLNTTVTETRAAGYLTVFPGWGTAPTASNLNWSGPGVTIPNLVTVRVAGGAIQFYNGSPGTVQVIADVSGYYTA